MALQAPVLHSTASSGFAISVLSQQDCVSALVTAAQQGPDPRTCQDGISHPQAEKPESTAWLSNRLHQSLLSAAMAEPELLLLQALVDIRVREFLSGWWATTRFGSGGAQESAKGSTRVHAAALTPSADPLVPTVQRLSPGTAQPLPAATETADSHLELPILCAASVEHFRHVDSAQARTLTNPKLTLGCSIKALHKQVRNQEGLPTYTTEDANTDEWLIYTDKANHLIEAGT
ncbi:MAG: hypothetical protein FRX49_09797 [Trebouxia sp. A1-2]|nr:MAG: hypothetical protein FRX49_09797 [Trebouxia sp. A1-2]